MTDYSKPMGHWCTSCACAVDIIADSWVPDVGAYCRTSIGHTRAAGAHDIVPVFAIIPEGERPSTNEPDDGDVLTNGSTTEYWVHENCLGSRSVGPSTMEFDAAYAINWLLKDGP